MSENNGKGETLTTGQALAYLVTEMPARGLEPGNWNSRTSGPGWLKIYRDNGKLKFSKQYQGTRPRFSYKRGDLDALLDTLEREGMGPGQPKADLSKLDGYSREQLTQMTARELAEITGHSEWTIWRYRSRGILPKPVRRGRRPGSGGESNET